MDIDRHVEGCAATHQTLLEVVDQLTDEQCRQPCALPGWSRGHLITHLARNADSFRVMLEAAQRGEKALQYPGGTQQRDADIEAGADRSAAELAADTRRSIYALEGAWANATHLAWQGAGINRGGAEVPMMDTVFLRWRECVIHLTDLDVGRGHDTWPPLYVRLELERQIITWRAHKPMGLTPLPELALRRPDNERLAWLLRRLSIEGLDDAPGLPG